MLKDVIITPLKVIKNENGNLMHMLKQTDEQFQSFGEIYFSAINPGKIKGWTCHKRMFLNLAVPIGNIKLVLYDGRNNSPSFDRIQEVSLGENNYHLVTIPPLIWISFKNIGERIALLANCATLPHDPKEMQKQSLESNEIPYNWQD